MLVYLNVYAYSFSATGRPPSSFAARLLFAALEGVHGRSDVVDPADPSVGTLGLSGALSFRLPDAISVTTSSQPRLLLLVRDARLSSSGSMSRANSTLQVALLAMGSDHWMS